MRAFLTTLKTLLANVWVLILAAGALVLLQILPRVELGLLVKAAAVPALLMLLVYTCAAWPLNPPDPDSMLSPVKTLLLVAASLLLLRELPAAYLGFTVQNFAPFLLLTLIVRIRLEWPVASAEGTAEIA